jgi:hypothetical protein
MNTVVSTFETLTPAQADVISSAVTLLSALVVAIIAPLTFHLIARGGIKDYAQAVNDLKAAAESARTQSQTIRDSMGTVRGVATQVTDLGVLIASVQEALANTQNSLLESRGEAGQEGQAQGNRDRIKALWRGLQELVERMAARPRINGNTRAKYARVDRRGYLKLVGTMLDDGHLFGRIEDWRAAYGFWTAALRGATEPSTTDLERMIGLERRLREANAAGDAAQAALPRTPPAGLSPGVLMTPTNIEAESARDHIRANMPKAPSRDGQDGDQPGA